MMAIKDIITHKEGTIIDFVLILEGTKSYNDDIRIVRLDLDMTGVGIQQHYFWAHAKGAKILSSYDLEIKKSSIKFTDTLLIKYKEDDW